MMIFNDTSLMLSFFSFFLKKKNLAKLSCLLLKDDNIRYHSQKFLLSGYIDFSKQVLKNYYSEIDIYMLNNYPNFVCDQNSYTNKINFL